MSWKCPACQSEIQHDGTSEPQRGKVYRCAVCRLELMADTATGKMALAPLQSDKPPQRRDKVEPGASTS